MLVLSRKVGDKLVIDGNITVEVVKIQGNRISLGIEFCFCHRGEDDGRPFVALPNAISFFDCFHYVLWRPPNWHLRHV